MDSSSLWHIFDSSLDWKARALIVSWLMSLRILIRFANHLGVVHICELNLALYTDCGTESGGVV